jgi:predicted nicotinamide N-methyase
MTDSGFPAKAEILDRKSFIRRETRVRPVPHAPEISLHLADEALPLWHRTEEELEQIGLPPPYWAFAWAGGQALARHLLDHPELVAGRSVLDFGAGSGLVAIAAMKAGAVSALAVEIDEFACEAIALNAALNDVTVDVESGDVLAQGALGRAVVLVGDMCYERPLAERVTAWLERCVAEGADVLLGDPGRSYLPKDRLRQLATYTVPVTPDLEDAEVKRTSVWTLA